MPITIRQAETEEDRQRVLRFLAVYPLRVWNAAYERAKAA
jgi:hypothetical protein